MIKVIKATLKDEKDRYESPTGYRCTSCGKNTNVITKLEIPMQVPFSTSMFLCSDCIRELTKVLTSNKYLDSDDFEEVV